MFTISPRSSDGRCCVSVCVCWLPVAAPLVVCVSETWPSVWHHVTGHWQAANPMLERGERTPTEQPGHRPSSPDTDRAARTPIATTLDFAAAFSVLDGGRWIPRELRERADSGMGLWRRQTSAKAACSVHTHTHSNFTSCKVVYWKYSVSSLTRGVLCVFSSDCLE